VLFTIIIIGKRLANFNVGVTNTNPSEQTPTPINIEVCATQEAALAAGETKTFDCVATGRYVVVQLNGTGFLTLCEVEVLGGKTGGGGGSLSQTPDMLKYWL
jgi:hypothetical protein